MALSLESNLHATPAASTPVFRNTTAQDRVLARPAFWRRHFRGLIALGISITALALVAQAWMHASGVAMSVDRSRLTITTVERGGFVRDVAADGLVVAAVSPTLYAPAAGSITLKVNAGDAVSKGEILAVIDLSALEVEIKVPQSLARDLAVDQKADLEGNGHHWKGSVSAISPEVVNGEVVARVQFDDAGALSGAGANTDKGNAPIEGLRQSERIAVRIFLDRRDDVLMVDRGSFVDQNPGFAYVLQGEVAERRAVSLGAASVQKVEVLAGLAVGDHVVISGTDAFNGASRVLLAH